jgi:hypothetical protein
MSARLSSSLPGWSPEPCVSPRWPAGCGHTTTSRRRNAAAQRSVRRERSLAGGSIGTVPPARSTRLTACRSGHYLRRPCPDAYDFGMPKWKIVSGARAFHQFPDRELSAGWARDLLRRGEMRTVNVCVARDTEDATDLPEECRAAIKSHGRSVVNAILDEEIPPRIVDVTTTGLVYDYGEEPAEDDEDDDEDEDEDDDDFDDEDDDDDLSSVDHDASSASA